MGNQLTVSHETNETYIGSIKNNKYHGKGKLYYNDSGDIYDGVFKNGLKHGHGEYQYYNGDKYIGEFYQNEMHGKGTYKSVNGYTYIGTFFLGSLVGKTEMYNINEELIFQGDFLNSVPHGFGIYYSNNKIVYVGNWKQNFFDGYGMLFNNDDYSYGIFNQGELINKIEGIELPAQFSKYIQKKNIQPIKSKKNKSNCIIMLENPFNNVPNVPIIKNNKFVRKAFEENDNTKIKFNPIHSR